MEKHIVASWGPDKKYSRHSEGDFLRLNDGRIMFVYSRFTDRYTDEAPSDLVVSYSDDEGESWSEPITLISASLYNTGNVMSVSAMRMNNGDVGIFYIVKQTQTHNRLMLSRSNDEGSTFYSHSECSLPDRAGYYVLNNDRVERLRNGRLVMPLAYHRCGVDKKVFVDGRSSVCFLLSDDDGITWHESADMIFPTFTGSESGLQEPGVIQKKNGVLWAYSRTDKMYQYESFSMDNGEHWTVPQPSRFTAPCSPMKIDRHPHTGDLYAIWNPIPEYNGRQISRAGWGRTPLVWAISKDDGMTWSNYTVIEDKEDHGYCYPAVFYTNDGCMLIAYCSGGPADGICLARLTIQKIRI